MKKFVSMMALLASSLAFASQQVTVTGTGHDLESAREDALQKAVMNACKSAVLSNRESRNREMTRNKVVVYNGCLVKNYTVADEEESGNSAKITINAEVVENHLPDRIVNDKTEYFFYDFNQHSDKVKQVQLKLRNAKKFVNEIFLDYPTSAYNLEKSDYQIDFDENKSYLKISYELTWNKNFINSIEDTFNILKDSDASFWDTGSPHSIEIRRKYVFHTMSIPEQTFKLLSDRRPYIRIKLTDSHNVEWLNVCQMAVPWYELYDVQNNNLIFKVKGKSSADLDIELPNNIPDDVELSMDTVDISFCQRVL